MMDWRTLDWHEIWAGEFAARQAAQGKRFTDDAEELAFWEALAPHYDERHRLNEEVPGLVDYLIEQIGTQRFVREIGPGTGNFTVPLAPYAARWEGIEFAPPMQREVEKKLRRDGLTHVRIRSGKWEDIAVDEPADILLAVNSLYRMEDIAAAFAKMLATTTEKLIFVRTLQYYESAADRYRGVAAQVHPDIYVWINMMWAQGLATDVRNFSFLRKYYADGRENVRQDPATGEDEYGVYRCVPETVVVATAQVKQ